MCLMRKTRNGTQNTAMHEKLKLHQPSRGSSARSLQPVDSMSDPRGRTETSMSEHNLTIVGAP